MYLTCRTLYTATCSIHTVILSSLINYLAQALFQLKMGPVQYCVNWAVSFVSFVHLFVVCYPDMIDTVRHVVCLDL